MRAASGNYERELGLNMTWIIASVPLWLAGATCLIFGIGTVTYLLRHGADTEVTGAHISIGIILSLVFFASSAGFFVIAAGMVA